MTEGAPSRGCLTTKTAIELPLAGKAIEARVKRLIEDFTALIRDALSTPAARRSKTKRSTSFRDVARRVWKRRPIAFRRKTKRGDPDQIHSAGGQPLCGDDDATSQGQQSNDLESPQSTQSAVLFPVPN